MEKIIDNIRTQFNTEGSLYYTSIKYTFLLGLVAHAYAFLHLQITHDSLGEFALTDELFGQYRVFEWKIALGRFMNPVFRFLFQDKVIRSWILGLLGILCIGISVCLVAQLFSLKSKGELLLISGIFVTNVTVISCVATYMGDFLPNMLALLFAVCAVFLWRKLLDRFSLPLFLLGTLLILLALGCYQSFLSVAIVLIIMCSIMDLLNEKTLLQVLRNNLIGIVMLGLGAVSYFFMVQFICSITGIPLFEGGYNSLSNIWMRKISWRQDVVRLYQQAVEDFISPLHFLENEKLSVLNMDTIFQHFIIVIHSVLIVIVLLIILCWLIVSRKNGKEKILLLFMFLLLPLGANISHIISGNSHDLMHYAFWIMYIFVLLLVRWAKEHLKWKNARVWYLGIEIVLSILILYNIQIANTLYVKKELVQQSTLSTMTRVLAKIEEQDGYTLGETQVAFIGTEGTVQYGIPILWEVNEITGGDASSSITYQQCYQSYFKNMLQYPICLCSNETLDSLKQLDIVQQMPIFPNKGSVQMIENVVVVKMSNKKK